MNRSGFHYLSIFLSSFIIFALSSTNSEAQTFRKPAPSGTTATRPAPVRKAPAAPNAPTILSVPAGGTVEITVPGRYGKAPARLVPLPGQKGSYYAVKVNRVTNRNTASGPISTYSVTLPSQARAANYQFQYADNRTRRWQAVPANKLQVKVLLPARTSSPQSVGSRVPGRSVGRPTGRVTDLNNLKDKTQVQGAQDQQESPTIDGILRSQGGGSDAVSVDVPLPGDDSEEVSTSGPTQIGGMNRNGQMENQLQSIMEGVEASSQNSTTDQFGQNQIMPGKGPKNYSQGGDGETWQMTYEQNDFTDSEGNQNIETTTIGTNVETGETIVDHSVTDSDGNTTTTVTRIDADGNVEESETFEENDQGTTTVEGGPLRGTPTSQSYEASRYINAAKGTVIDVENEGAGGSRTTTRDLDNKITGGVVDSEDGSAKRREDLPTGGMRTIKKQILVDPVR